MFGGLASLEAKVQRHGFLNLRLAHVVDELLCRFGVLGSRRCNPVSRALDAAFFGEGRGNRQTVPDREHGDVVVVRTSGVFTRFQALLELTFVAVPKADLRLQLGERGEDAVSVSRALTAELSGTDDMGSLRRLAARDLVNALDGFQLPIVDGVSLPDEPAVVFMQGEQADVPYLTGGNSYEGSVQRGSGITLADVASGFAYADCKIFFAFK